MRKPSKTKGSRSKSSRRLTGWTLRRQPARKRSAPAVPAWCEGCGK
jgi:hypothetical protein